MGNRPAVVRACLPHEIRVSYFSKSENAFPPEIAWESSKLHIFVATHLLREEVVVAAHDIEANAIALPVESNSLLFLPILHTVVPHRNHTKI